MKRHIRLLRTEDSEEIIALALRAWEPVFASLKAVMDKDIFETLYPGWRTVPDLAAHVALTIKRGGFATYCRGQRPK
jgi:hypothetical protein